MPERPMYRTARYLVPLSMLGGAGVGAVLSSVLTGRVSEGANVGLLFGLAVGALLTREARPLFAVALLLLLLGGAALIVYFFWGATGTR